METKNDIAIEAAVTEKTEQLPTTEKKKRVRKPKASPAAENEEAAKVETEVIGAKKLQDSVEHTDAEGADEDTSGEGQLSNSEDESTAARLRDMIEDQLVADIPEEKEEEFVFDDEFLDIPDSFTEDEIADDIPLSDEDEANSLAALLYDDDEFTITEESEGDGPVSFAQLRIEMQKIRDDARELRGEPNEIPETDEIPQSEYPEEKIEGQISLDEEIDEIEAAVEKADEPSDSETETTEDDVKPTELSDERPENVTPIMAEAVNIPETPREHVITINRDRIKEKVAPNERFIDNVFEVVELFVFTLLAIMLISTFAFRHSVVEGSSMETTLFGGDHLLVSDLFYEPERGDIIICDDKSKGLFGIDAPIVKRVIALEGDTVRIDIYGQVYINDILLEEDYLDPNMKVAARGEEYVLTVPEGQVFVLGDNRFYSKDSDEFGPIDEDSILGKVILRFYPFDKIKVFN
jgi:signal peptidase I